MYKLACLYLLATGLATGFSVAPALAQNRFMDQAKEAAARRAENAAIRAAENPEPTRTAAQQPAPSQPAATEAAPAQAAPAIEPQPAAPAPAQ